MGFVIINKYKKRCRYLPINNQKACINLISGLVNKKESFHGLKYDDKKPVINILYLADMKSGHALYCAGWQYCKHKND
jgi:hypothetical protein